MEEQVIAKLKDKGCKITPQRRAIIRTLLKLEKFPTAHAILNDIRQTYPDVGLDTVYRNLNLLTVMGVVNQIGLTGKDTKVFELVSSAHHHHLVCLHCGDAQCLDYCPVNEQDVQKAAAKDFQIVGHSLELYGYCRECRQKVQAH